MHIVDRRLVLVGASKYGMYAGCVYIVDECKGDEMPSRRRLAWVRERLSGWTSSGGALPGLVIIVRSIKRKMRRCLCPLTRELSDMNDKWESRIEANMTNAQHTSSHRRHLRLILLDPAHYCCCTESL